MKTKYKPDPTRYEHVRGYLLAPLYGLAKWFDNYYYNVTNTCMNGCSKCTNYHCKARTK